MACLPCQIAALNRLEEKRMKTFVTGSTGFIGGHLVHKLLDRNYQVTCLVRNPHSEPAQRLRERGASLVLGDILEPETMRTSMTQADIVFHLAGWYKVGAADSTPALPINVQGTRTVLELAHELRVENIVHTSTVGVFGNTHGQVVDESYRRSTPFTTEYNRTKTMAQEIATELIAQGAPIRIVMPGSAYGPGDHSVLATFLRAFLRGFLPLIPGADSGISLVHVQDVAEGLVLAAEKGKAGEKYILAGPSITYGEMLRQVAQVANRRPPLLIPSWPMAILGRLSRLGNHLIPLPTIIHPETLQNLQGVTFWASGAKAQRLLGWQSRPLEEGLEETLEWELQRIKKS